MASETQLNGSRQKPHSGAALRRGVSGLVHDVIELAELQAELVAIDLQDMRQRALWPLGLLLGAIIVALGALPVLLLAVGWALVRQGGWSEGAAFAASGGCALLLALLSAWIGWKGTKTALSTLLRSKQELTDNLRWLKKALVHRQSA